MAPVRDGTDSSGWLLRQEGCGAYFSLWPKYFETRSAEETEKKEALLTEAMTLAR